MRQARIGRDRCLAVANALMCRNDHRHLARQSHALAQGRRARLVVRLRIECGEGRDGRAQHVHGVGSLDRRYDVEDRHRQLAGALEVAIEAGKLRGARQLAM